MGAKQPSWVKDLLGKKKDIPEQVTVVRRLKSFEQPTAGQQPRPAMGAIQYTGSGENGIPEPNMPVDMVNTQQGAQTRHEAELAVGLPDGRTIMVPSSVLGQQAIQYIEQQAKMPGMATGGVYQPQPTVYSQPISASIQQPSLSKTTGGINLSGRTTTVPSPATPTITPAPAGEQSTLQMPDRFGGIKVSSATDVKAVQGGEKDPIHTMIKPSVRYSDPLPSISSSVPALQAPPPLAPVAAPPVPTVMSAPPSPTISSTVPTLQAPPPPAPVAAPPSPTISSTVPTFNAPDAAANLPPPGEQPPPADDKNQQRIESTAQYWENVMNGMEPTDRDLARWYLSNYDTAAGSDTQALMARISRDPNMSESGKNTMLAKLERGASVGRGQMLGTMASDAVQRKDNAALNLHGVAKGERTYKDSRADLAYDRGISERDYQDTRGDLAYNRQREADQNAFNSAVTLKDWKGAGAAYKRMTGLGLDVSTLQAMTDAELRDLTAPQVSTSSRVGTLFAANTNLSGMKTDQQLRAAVAHDLGVDVDDPAVDQEIELQYKAYLASNKGQFASNTETLIGNVKDNGGTAADALNDPSIRQNVAAFLAVDPNTEDGKRKVDNYISDTWTQLSKSPVDRAFETVWNDVIPEQYKDTPGAEAAISQFVKDMYYSGQIGADGMPTEGNVVVWPWQNSGTFYNYVDWNGNDIDYNSPPDSTTELSAEGNGTTYQYKDPSTGEPRAWTFADVEREWKGLSPSEQSEYFNGSKFNSDAFIRDRTLAQKDGGQDPDGRTRIEQFAEFRNTFGTTYAPAFPESYRQLAAVGADGNAVDSDAAANMNNPTGLFGYYDEVGVYHVVSQNDQVLRNAYWDLSDNLNNGDPMDYETFSQLWGNGSAWRLNTDGHVLNFDASFQASNGLSADGKYMITKTPEEYQQGRTVSIPTSFNSGTMTKTDSGQGAVKTDALGWVYPGWNYPTSIYTAVKSGDSMASTDGDILAYAQFNDSFVGWVNENIGNVITINGKTYIVDGIAQRVKHGVSRAGPYYMDELVLLDPQTGRPVAGSNPDVYFGGRFILADTRNDWQNWS